MVLALRRSDIEYSKVLSKYFSSNGKCLKFLSPRFYNFLALNLSPKFIPTTNKLSPFLKVPPPLVLSFEDVPAETLFP